MGTVLMMIVQAKMEHVFQDANLVIQGNCVKHVSHFRGKRMLLQVIQTGRQTDR